MLPASAATLGLSQSQVDTLDSLCSAALASLTDEEALELAHLHLSSLKPSPGEPIPTVESLCAFAKLGAKDLHVTKSLMAVLAATLPRDKISLLKLALTAFGTSLGTFAVTGMRFARLQDYTRQERERAMVGFTKSELSDIRTIAKATQAVSLWIAFGKSMENLRGGGRNVNPLWDALGFTGVPSEQGMPMNWDHVWKPAFMELSCFIDIDALASSASGNVVELETDVVIVGSGAGGGVVAAELAQAGLRVIVLEKGIHRHVDKLTHNEHESFGASYESHGIFQSDNGSIMILAGSTFGGGTAINWSASLRLPDPIRQEWATTHKLPFFTSQDFTNSITAVCKRAGIHEDAVPPHNIPNQILQTGCQRLGYHVASVPQNTAGADHRCGFCGLGCPYAEKQGTHLTFLKDAAEAGALFVQDCYVDSVLHKNGQATGISAHIGTSGVRVKITCKTVVSSAGSLHTPALLHRSGLHNKHIGANLRLHPVAFLRGFFPDRVVNPHVGPILTTVSNVVADRNGTGYGARLEVPFMLPGLFAVTNSYQSAFDVKRKMLQFNHSSPMIAIMRDYDSVARIKQDKDGKLHVKFELGKEDEAGLVDALVAGTKILLAAGAQEVDTSQIGMDSLRLNEEEMKDPIHADKTVAFLKQIRAVGMRKKVVGSAHQMGSCRMGSTEAAGAVDAQGQSFEVKGLYVADASLFPTASGVNPMFTILALSHHVAQCIKKNVMVLHSA
ncbi:hypothetical protein HDU98_009985 [Podochytrium sp. JEL0797]|nr:hypothetical protein HDU98_009985 [Podochytrium sp. JEL0797]